LLEREGRPCRRSGSQSVSDLLVHLVPFRFVDWQKP